MNLLTKKHCYFGGLSVGILNEIPLRLDVVWMLLLLLELFPLPCPLPSDPNVGMFCFVDELECCCSCANSPAVEVCCFGPLPVSITIFEVPVGAASPVDWRRGLVSWERREEEAVVVVCFSGRRKVADRVTWGLLSEDCEMRYNIQEIFIATLDNRELLINLLAYAAP